VSGSHAAPAARDGQKNVRLLSDEIRLQLGSEHEVAVAQVYCGQSGKNSAPYAEIHRSHVRAFFGTLEAQCNSPEIRRVHFIPSRLI